MVIKVLLTSIKYNRRESRQNSGERGEKFIKSGCKETEHEELALLVELSGKLSR